MEARDVSLFAETAQEIGEQKLNMQISCWIDIGRGETMQPHVLAALHMHHRGVVLCRASCDKLTTEVVHGKYTVASTLQYHRGLLGAIVMSLMRKARTLWEIPGPAASTIT